MIRRVVPVMTLLLALVLAVSGAAAELQCRAAGDQRYSDMFNFRESQSHKRLRESLPEQLSIRNIRIIRLPVFDKENPQERNWLYDWANDFHRLTWETVLREQLLFTAGEAYNDELMEESERILRELKFIYDARIRPYQVCGDQVDLEVITRDVWTFTPIFSFTRAGGANEYDIGLRDTNFLGSGKEIQLKRESDAERTGTTILYKDRAILHSRWRGAVIYTDNDDGYERRLRLVRPFYSLDTSWQAGFDLEQLELEDRTWYRGEEVAEFEHEVEDYEVFGGLSKGRQENRVHRWLYGFQIENHYFDFSDSDRPPAQLPEDREIAYPYIGFESLEDKFSEFHNLNDLSRTEDVFVGERYKWRLGWSDESFGATKDLLAFGGSYSRAGILSDKQLVFGELDTNGFWDVEASDFENLWLTGALRYHYRQSRRWGLFGHLRLDYTDGLTDDNQLTLGGDSGLRGYEQHYQVGDRSFLVNIEQRYYPDWHPFKLIRVGAAAFFDVGRAWFTDRDNGSNGGVLKNAGIGLRLTSSRAEKGRMMHIDLAVPFDKDDDVDDVQLLVTVKSSF